MTNTSNLGPPRGAGGKSVSSFNPDNDKELSEGEVNNMVDSLGRKQGHILDPLDKESVSTKNLARTTCNEKRAGRHANPNFIEDVSDDESILEDPFTPPITPLPSASSHKLARAFSFLNLLTPTTHKAIEATFKATSSSKPSSTIPSTTSTSDSIIFKDSDTILTKSTDSAFEIPRPILNLAKARIHVPLTLLTGAALRKIHADPSVIKMTKGLVLDDPKLSVMDVSVGFPAETTLTGDRFYEAYRNFLKLLKLIADDATVKCFKDHRDFCLSRDEFTDDFPSVLNFDIETRRKCFNNQTFHRPDAYLQRWNKVKINTSLHPGGSSRGGGGSCYNPYPPHKNEDSSSVNTASEGKSFQKGKGANNSDSLLCIICGRNGHRASGCTHTHTTKSEPVVSMWNDKLILKSSSSPICISFNIGKCHTPRHSSDIIHVCSVCGDKSHGATSKSCL